MQSCRNAKEDGDVRFYQAMHPSGMRYGPERCTLPPEATRGAGLLRRSAPANDRPTKKPRQSGIPEGCLAR
jgi:hypothetical protein